MDDLRTDSALRAALDLVPDGALVHRDGRVLVANDAAGAAFGLADGAALVGRHVRDFLDADTMADVTADGARLRHGAPLLRRRRARWADGTVVVLEAHGRAVELDGAPATLVTLRDVTAEEVAQERLLASEARHLAAFESLAAGARRALDEARLVGLETRMNEAEIVTTPGGTIVSVNDRACALYGYAREELVGQDVGTLRPPGARAEVGPDLAAARAEGLRIEVDHRRKDGSLVPVALSSRAFEVGGATYLHTLARDLTAERRAAHDQRVLARLVAAMSDAVFVSDADLRVTEWSGGAEAIFGWTRAEALGRSILDDFESELAPGALDAHLASIARGEAFRAEVRVRRKDSAFADLEMHVEPLRAPGGRVDGWLTVARDVGPAIAARRALEAADARLRAAEANTREVLGRLPDAVLVARDGRTAFANDAAAALLGYDAASELVGRPATDVVPDDAASQVRADFDRLARGERVVAWRPMRRRDGSRCVVEVHGAPLRFEGAPAVVAVLRDRAAIDEAQRVQRATAEELRSTVAAMAEGVVVQARDGRILRANAAAERILGLTRAELEGRTSVDPRWRAVHEDGSDFPGETHPAMVTLRTGEPCEHVLMGVHTPAGELRWISISSEPLCEAPGAAPYAVVTTFVDVTALRRVNAELREALAKVKTLSGFLPICMYCKNVRDDEGYWQRLESYIADHSDALVSHGLCPTCAREHFPDVFDDDGEEG